MLYLNLQCGEPRQESVWVYVLLRLVYELAIALLINHSAILNPDLAADHWQTAGTSKSAIQGRGAAMVEKAAAVKPRKRLFV